jgi:hypothetical protein
LKKLKEEPRVYLSNWSINPTSAHSYYTPLNGFQSSGRHQNNYHNLEDNAHEGKVSYKGRKNLEKCISWLLYLSKPKRVFCSESGKAFTFQINFITLTLPAKQQHPDKEITSRCLKNFLDVCRKYINLENYIWRAEAQANGNIHFHLVTDKFIPFNDLRKWWNQSVELLGYVSAFEKKWKHRNPNSVDVHSVKHIKRIASYLSKYMSKERAFSCIGELRKIKGEFVEVLYGSTKYRLEQAGKKDGIIVGHVLGGKIRAIESRLWMASRSLTSMKNLKVCEDSHEFADIEKLIQAVDARVYYGDFVASYYGDFVPVCRKILSSVASPKN